MSSASLAHPYIGCDVTPVADIEFSVREFGDRFIDRILTPLERTQSRLQPDRIAARFAGKEAVMKVLRPNADDALPYRDIEIAVLPSGAPHVRLHGAARALAGIRKLGGFTVSLSHDGGIAFATALAIRTDRKSNFVTTDNPTIDAVRRLLDAYGNLSKSVSTLTDDDDLTSAGLTSHSSVNVMLAIEDEFGLEFPDELLSRSTFATIGSITGAVDTLRERAS